MKYVLLVFTVLCFGLMIKETVAIRRRRKLRALAEEIDSRTVSFSHTPRSEKDDENEDVGGEA